jgi:hypothetical protein
LSGFIFPDGFFSFRITNLTPGSTVTVTITLPSSVPINTQYWKCVNGQWVNITSLLSHNDESNILTLTLTDGGLGDTDGHANGTIVDPGGPAVPVPVQVTTVSAQPHVSPTLPQLKLAQMSLQYLTINPQQAAANQAVTISANVVNGGDQAGNYNVALKINGQVEQNKMISVGPRGTQPVKFTVTKAEPGTYDVDVGGQTGSFTIVGTGNRTATPGSMGGLIIIFIIGMLILSTVVVLLLTFNHLA